MKKYIYFISILIITLLSCKKDTNIGEEDVNVGENPYASIEIQEPINNDSTGVTLKALILKHGTEEITDYGFVYSSYDSNPVELSLKDEVPIENNAFTKRFTLEFNPSKTYTIWAYVQHLEYRVVTDEIILKTIGGQNPQVLSINPHEVFKGDTVEIIGKYFSKRHNNKISMDGQTAQILNSSETSLKVIVPKWIYNYGNIDIEIVSDNWRKSINNDLNILKTEITSIEPNIAFAGDIVKIHGNNLSYKSYDPTLFFLNKSAAIVSKSPNELEVIVPGGYYNDDFEDYIVTDFEIEIYNNNTSFESNFTIKQQWSKSHDLNMTPGYLTKSVVYNENAYFIGFSSGYYRLLKFDIENQDLDKVSDYPGNYDAESELAIYDDYIYIFKGEWDRTIRRYHIPSDTWDSLGVLPFESGKISSLKNGTDLYFILWNQEIYKFSFLTHEFQKLKDLPADFYYFASLFQYENKILVALNDQILEYNTNNDSWMVYADYSESNTPFSHGSFAFVLYNEIYLFRDFYDSQSSIYKYNSSLNIWIELADTPWDLNCERTWFVHNNKLNTITSGEGDYFSDRSYHYSFSR